ncbi:MAG: peroxidase family protein, partial [Ilumatobacteraceae bacterium]
AGDGRANENIGLTAVHHVFHSEHNRLAEEIQTMIETDRAFTAAERAEWQTFNAASGFSYTERLFQAARLVTEMEYQHLVFEEFARKVQPAVNLFGEGGTGYQTDLDPRITAEFAHAVYRFGHSMLTETLDRTNGEGVQDNMLLLDAFLNPPRFFDGETSAAEAAGNIIRGMTRQYGNELDEFVTEALRNDLVGLPLDLAALNITRGRETGIPTMNNFRRALYGRTLDFGLAPYSNWLDFGTAMRNESSLVNFVAAYGTHPTIVGTTEVAGKRAAAAALFALASTPVADPGADGTAEEVAAFNAYDDALNFLRSTGSWANIGTASRTGLDDVDLWMGGMAEAPMVGGGLLGPTFNYVFEVQMESLQDGDRFYYLSRMAGLNLLTQLEGNSFAELIMRNTDVQGLPADTFSTPTYVFDLAAQELAGPIVDDPATEWDERTLLTRELDGTIRYRGEEHVYFHGAPRADGVRSGLGDDTVRGNDGNDRLEGGDGNDHILGGVGDDIITDFFGVEMIKGGPGDDTISSGRGGGDLNFGGDGNDFIIGGNDATESFGGPGNDFIFAGDDLDTVFGDEGNDWIEGGRGPFNLLQGDTGAPFQDDPVDSGHDILFGWGGEQDYDAEGGDDIMFVGPGIQRAEGMMGFDWATHRSDPVAADSDMSIVGALPPAVFTNRDRFDLVEGLSGWQFNDVLRGDNRVAADFLNNVLTNAGANRIAGIQQLEQVIPGGIPFNDGNIILGGGGSDLIEGRGGNDVIDGDRWLNAVLTAPDLSTPATGDRVEHDFLTTLRADILSGAIDPGSIQIARRIETAAPDASVDTAMFSDVQANYVITKNTNTGVVTVQHVGARATDGTDTLLNMERLLFADGEVQLAVLFNTAATGDVTIDNLTPTENETLTATATVEDAEGIGLGGVEIVWEMQVEPGLWEGVGSGSTLLLTDLHVGKQLRAIAVFEDGVGVPEQVTGTAVTAPVINVNDLPVGLPRLSVLGTVSPEAGSPVSVDLTPVTDEDGIPSTVTVQWQQNNTLGAGAYANIPGATGTTFTPLLGQEGRRLRVVYTFTDLHGTTESVVSNRTGRVIVLARPELSAPAVTDFGLRAVGAAFPQRVLTVTNVGTAPLTVTGTTIGGTDAALFSVLPGGCPAPVLPTESCTITVVFATDGAVGAKSATLTLTSNDLRGPITVGLAGSLRANTLPTGIPVVDDITPIEAQTLSTSTASIADVDGLTTANYTYQWQQSAAGGAGVISDIAGATGSTLTLTQAQVNRRVRVVVTFTDDLGSLQSVVSALTGIVGDQFLGTAAA